MASDRDVLIEQLADAEHASWARWMEYLFSKCEVHGLIQDTGKLCIPAGLVTHWKRQVQTPYADLSDREKQSDREAVARILPFIEAYAARATDRTAEVEAFTRLAEFARSRALLLNRGCDDHALADEILDYLGQILGPLPGDAALSGSSAAPDGGG
jgi:hypothetical protein